MIFCRGYVAWIVSRELIFASTNSFSLLKVVLKNWQRKLPTAEPINNPLKKKTRKNLALRRILSLRLKAKKKKKSPLTSCVVGLPFESVTSRLPTALFSSTSRLWRVLYAVVTAVSFSCCLVMDDKGVWNEKKVSHTEGHDTRRPNKQKKDSWKTNRWNEE